MLWNSPTHSTEAAGSPQDKLSFTDKLPAGLLMGSRPRSGSRFSSTGTAQSLRACRRENQCDKNSIRKRQRTSFCSSPWGSPATFKDHRMSFSWTSKNQMHPYNVTFLAWVPNVPSGLWFLEHLQLDFSSGCVALWCVSIDSVVTVWGPRSLEMWLRSLCWSQAGLVGLVVQRLLLLLRVVPVVKDRIPERTEGGVGRKKWFKLLSKNKCFRLWMCGSALWT